MDLPCWTCAPQCCQPNVPSLVPWCRRLSRWSSKFWKKTELCSPWVGPFYPHTPKQCYQSCAEPTLHIAKPWFVWAWWTLLALPWWICDTWPHYKDPWGHGIWRLMLVNPESIAQWPQIQHWWGVQICISLLNITCSYLVTGRESFWNLA